MDKSRANLPIAAALGGLAVLLLARAAGAQAPPQDLANLSPLFTETVQAAPAHLDALARTFEAAQLPLVAAAVAEAERNGAAPDEGAYRALVRWQFWMGKKLDPQNGGLWREVPAALHAHSQLDGRTGSLLPALQLVYAQALGEMAARRGLAFDALVWWRERALVQRRLMLELYDVQSGGYGARDSSGRRVEEPLGLGAFLPVAFDAPVVRTRAAAIAESLLVGSDPRASETQRTGRMTRLLDPEASWPRQPGLRVMRADQTADLLAASLADILDPDLASQVVRALRAHGVTPQPRIPLTLGDASLTAPLHAGRAPQLSRTRCMLELLVRALVLTPQERDAAVAQFDALQAQGVAATDSLALALHGMVERWRTLDPLERRTRNAALRQATPQPNGDAKMAAFGWRDEDLVKWTGDALDRIAEDAIDLLRGTGRDPDYAAQLLPHVAARGTPITLHVRYRSGQDATNAIDTAWWFAWTNGTALTTPQSVLLGQSGDLELRGQLPPPPDRTGFWWLVLRGPDGRPADAPAVSVVEAIVASVRAAGQESDPPRTLFVVEVTNQVEVPQPARFEVLAPPEWLVEPRADVSFTLDPQQTARWTVQLSPRSAVPPGTYPVKWRFHDDRRLVSTLETPVPMHLRWLTVGPFESQAKGPNDISRLVAAISQRFGPEGPIDLGQPHTTLDGPSTWRHLPSNALEETGYVTLARAQDKPGVWYALTGIATSSREVTAFLEADGPAVLRVNGEEAARTEGLKRSSSGDVAMRAGTNYVLVKAVGGGGRPARFRLRLGDADQGPLHAVSNDLEHLLDGYAYIAGHPELPVTAAEQARTEFRLVPITFVDPAAGTVAVVGSFNGWSPAATPMTKLEDGRWRAEIRLNPGSFEYKLAVNGARWISDPENPASVPDGFGGRNSVLKIE